MGSFLHSIGVESNRENAAPHRRFTACWSVTAAAQVTGEFYLEKKTFAPGEPVFLYLKVSNHGPNAILMFEPDIDQPACSGHSITVTTDPPPAYSCPNLADTGCTINGPPKQLPSLLPGQSNIQRDLLNFNHEINAPGGYLVKADHIGLPLGTRGETHAYLRFRVDGSAPPYSAAKLQPWADQLTSADGIKRYEAAQILASLGPPALEKTLLGFPGNPEFRRYAPLALHRLNTRTSLQALADMAKASGPGSWEQMEADLYLGKTDDRKCYPLQLGAER